MKHAICLLCLVIITCAISILYVQYGWSDGTYFMTCLGVGAMLGYVSGKVGYET